MDIREGLEAFPLAPVAAAPNPTPSEADLSTITNAFTQGGVPALSLQYAQERGNDLATQNQIMQDRNTMSGVEFISRYGAEMDNKMAQIGLSSAELLRLRSAQDRSGWRRTGDNLNSISTGLLGGLGDVATLGAGLVNNSAGAFMAENVGDFRDWAGSHMTQEAQNSRMLAGIRAELDEQDNRNQYDRDMAEGRGGLEANLAYFGRGFLNGATRLFEDGTNFEMAAAEGIGSLFAGGPVSKGVSMGARGLAAIGRAVTREAGEELAESAAQAAAVRAGRASWGDTATMPIAIGLQEGGSAYAGAMSEVMGMSHDALMANSAQYRSLIDSGVSREEARETVAGSAATAAAAIVAPLAGITGKLVAGFEASPLAGATMRDVVQNILKETTEEGIQSMTGQIGQNVGIQQTADASRPWMQGVGDATAEGAILGSVIGGVVQAPAATRNAARGAWGAVADRLTERANRIEHQNLTDLGLDDETLTTAVEEADAPETTEALQAGVEEAVSNLTPEQAEEIEESTGVDLTSLKDMILSARELPSEKMTGMSDEITKHFGDNNVNTSNRFAVWKSLADYLDNDQNSEMSRVEAALFLRDQMGENLNLYTQVLPQVLQNEAEDSASAKSAKALAGIFERVMASPALSAALDRANEMIANQAADMEGDVTDQSAKLAAKSALLDATSLSPETAERILDRDDEVRRGHVEGKRLSAADRTALTVSAALGRVQQDFNSDMAIQNDRLSVDPDYKTPASSLVAQQIEETGGHKAHQLSLKQHAQRITQAHAAGDVKTLKKSLKHLREFAQSMANKAEAANVSVKTGKQQTYLARGATGMMKKGEEKLPHVTIHGHSATSLGLARSIHADARAAADLANALSSRFAPNAKQVKVPDLAPEIETNIQNLLKKTAKSETKVSPVAQVRNLIAGRSGELERHNRKERIKDGETRGNTLSIYSSRTKTLTVNAEKILKDFEKNMPYLNETVGLVMKNADLDHMKAFFKKSGAQTYARFVIENGILQAIVNNPERALRGAMKRVGYVPLVQESTPPTDQNQKGGSKPSVLVDADGYPRTAEGFLDRAEFEKITGTRKLTEAEKALFDDLRDRMVEAFGLPESMFDGIDFEVRNLSNTLIGSKALGRMTPARGKNRPIMSISPYMMARGMVEARGHFEHMIMHEFGHYIDHSLGDPNANFRSFSEARQYDKGGVVRAEIEARMAADPAAKGYFEGYVYSHPDNDAFTRSEIFADQMSRFMLKPELFEANYPETAKLLRLTLATVYPKSKLATNATKESKNDQTATAKGTPNRGSKGDQALATIQSRLATESGIDTARGGLNSNAEGGVTMDKTLVERFPLLVATKTVSGRAINWFAHAYKPVKEALAPRLAGEAAPLARLMEAFETNKGLLALRGSELPYEVTAENREGMSDLLEGMADVKKALQTRVNNFLLEAGEEYLKGAEVGRFRRGRTMNLTDLTPEGLKLNDYLTDMALIATANWLVNTSRSDHTPTIEDVAEILNITVEEVSADDMDFFQTGLNVGFAKERLANEIKRYWGVTNNNNATIAYTDGIAEGFAADILAAIPMIRPKESSPSLVQIYNMERKDSEGNPRQYNRLIIDPDNAFKPLWDKISSAKALIEDTVIPEAAQNKHFSIGVDEGEIPRTQVRNPQTELTKHQRQAIGRVNGVEFNVNIPFAGFIRSLGEELFSTVMGHDLGKAETQATRHNAQDLARKKGKVLTTQLSFRNVLGRYDEVAAYAKGTGSSLGSTAVFFSWGINKANRPQMMGVNTPQSDKLARQVFSATKSILDMTNEATQRQFWKAIGQGLGLKTEKEFGNVIQDAAMALSMNRGGKLTTITTQLMKWLDKHDAAIAKGKQPPSGAAIFKEAAARMGGDFTMHAMDSLVEVAQYRRAVRDGKVTAFETHAYLEADGKTNGPINALVTLLGNAAGAFTGHWVDMVAKGGLFFTNQKKTLNDHIQSGNQEGKGANGEDLYKTSATTLRDFLEAFRAQMDPAIQEQMSRLLNTLDMLGQGVSVQVNHDDAGNPNSLTIEVDRGVTKNPLTVTVYGSGVNGIVDKLVHAMMGEVYSLMSKELQGEETLLRDDAFRDNMRHLLGRQVFTKTEDGEKTYHISKYIDQSVFKVFPEKGMPSATVMQRFVLDSKQKENISRNMRVLFGDHMVAAIHHTVMGSVEQNVKLIQRATQIQSIFQMTMFRRRIIEKLAEKATSLGHEDYRQGDFLSRNELNEILDGMNVFSPMVRSAFQNYVMSASQKSELFKTTEVIYKNQKVKVSMPESLSASLTDDLRADVRIHGPSLAGVRGIPTTVIGGGDGLMMQLLFSLIDANYKAVGVFDGLNMAVDQIENLSEKANEAVRRTWTENNAMENLRASFEGFLKNNPVRTVTKAFTEESDPLLVSLRSEMAKVIENKFKPDNSSPSNEAMEGFLLQTLGELDIAAKQTADIQETLKRVSTWIDQMAGGEMGHGNVEGMVQIEEGLTPDEIAAKLNEVREQVKRERLENEDASESSKAAKAIEQKALPKKAREAFARIAEKAGQSFEGSKAIFMRPDRSLLNALKAERDNISPDTYSLLVRAIETAKQYNMQIVVGDHAALAEAATQLSPNISFENGIGYSGKYDVDNRIIYLRGMNPDTLLHELIHATTFAKVATYYADPKSLSAEDRAAIKRIEAIRDEWVRDVTDTENGYDNPEFAKANKNMMMAMADKRGDQNPAVALNEFMAWALSNQHIVEAMREKTLVSSLARIAGKALEALKTLLWGSDKAPRVGRDALSNLRFNTMVLLKTDYLETKANNQMLGYMLYQSEAYGNNARLNKISEHFMTKIAELRAQFSKPEQLIRQEKEKTEAGKAYAIAEQFANQGQWDMTSQELTVFGQIVAAMMSNAKINPNAMVEYQSLFQEFIRGMSIKDFLDNASEPSPEQDAIAQLRYNSLQGLFQNTRDAAGRSTLLASFVALANTNEGFRKVLERKGLTKETTEEGVWLDDKLNNAGQAAMDMLARSASGRKKNEKSMLEAVDNLMEHMTLVSNDTVLRVENTVESKIDMVDEYIGTKRERLSEAMIRAAQKMRGKGKGGDFASDVTTILARGLTDEGADANGRGAISMMNSFGGQWNDLRRLVGEVVGMTSLNAPFLMMVTKSKTMVDQSRQIYVETLPKILKKAFKNEVAEGAMSAALKGMARTGMATLMNSRKQDAVMKLLTSETARKAEISRLEEALTKADAGRASLWFQKGKQLAHRMNTGISGAALLSNALAIQALPGHSVFGRPVQTSLDATGQMIDDLVSLYAMDGLPKATIDAIQGELTNNAEGMSFLFSTLRGTHLDEMAKMEGNPVAALNHRKGFIRAKKETGQHLVLADLEMAKRLKSMGYQKVGEYTGERLDPTSRHLAYYYLPLSGQNRYSQGIAQVVQSSVYGVDAISGRSVTGDHGGFITDPNLVKSLVGRMSRMGNTSEGLIPVFDQNGNVVAFERTMAPEQLARLRTNDELPDMLGVWQGRQVEEEIAKTVNSVLLERSASEWKKARLEGRLSEYVDISRSRDPLHRDAWGMIPASMKAEIKEQFGEAGFPIPRDLVEDIVGVREASIGDVWSGMSRWPAGARDEVRKVIMGAFGPPAYRWLVQTERFVQDRVTDAKVIIVIKSMVVPAANLVSNIYQLRNLGVPWSSIIRGLRGKTHELNSYVKHRADEVAIRAELKAAEGREDVREVRKLKDQLQSVEDIYRRMSIWPLIEAGEFTSISDVTVTREQLELANGRWTDMVDSMAAKMPEGLKQAYRYGLVTKDTPLFRAMATATQYGDFLGKAIMYDHLIQKGKNAEESLKEINEEFVNYNRYSSRTRSYAESVGVTWFWPFKLRSVKIAARTLRRHPTRALMQALLVPDFPILGPVGNPIKDNIFGSWWQGKLGYSIGWGMGLNAPSMLPWANVSN